MEKETLSTENISNIRLEMLRMQKEKDKQKPMQARKLSIDLQTKPPLRSVQDPVERLLLEFKSMENKMLEQMNEIKQEIREVKHQVKADIEQLKSSISQMKQEVKTIKEDLIETQEKLVNWSS